MDLSIIIVNWNTRDLLRRCLASVEATVRGLSWEAIVVDNASSDGSAAMVRQEFLAVRLIENSQNRGFGAANNQALRLMAGRYALLLNSDAVLTTGAVRELFDFMERTPAAAMAGGQLLNADGSRQNSVAAFPSPLTLLTNASLLEFLFPQRFPGKRHDYPGPIEVDSVIGACMVVRKAAIDTVGLFDERYFFFFEETDWALQMRAAGWKIYHVPTARIYHLQGQSIGGRLRSRIAFYRSRYQYFRKWESPARYRLIGAVIVLRLGVNWLLTGLGVLTTLGLQRGLRERWALYGRLLLWHLRGCP